MTEFNLSEKRESMSNCYGYSDESVKEFIRLLKEVIDQEHKECVFNEMGRRVLQNHIDKLAGDKLLDAELGNDVESEESDQ